MIGRLNPKSRQCAVVGGGISGLLAAYRLCQSGYEVELFEASDRLGGLINTVSTPYGIAEKAAHSLLVSPPVYRLFEELQVPLAPVERASRARYILRDGKMKRFPLTPLEAVSAVIRALTRSGRGEETLEAWGLRHLGKPAVDFLLTPFVLGVYGAAPDELSLDAAFAKMKVPAGKTLLSHLTSSSKHKKERSRSPKMMAPSTGMKSLLEALERELVAKATCKINRKQKLERLPDFENVVLTVPAHSASQLLESVDRELSNALREVRYAPLVTCTLFCDLKKIRNPAGVGVLIPVVENRKILGVLFNSSSFPNRVKSSDEWASFTVMLGGTLHPEVLNESDEQIRGTIEQEFQSLFELKGQIEHIQITRWSHAVPVYSRELFAVWETAKRTWAAKEGNVLFGNYTGKVSIRGMIEDAESFLQFSERSMG